MPIWRERGPSRVTVQSKGDTALSFRLRRLFAATSVFAALALPALGATASPAAASNGKSNATIVFQLDTDQCVLTATSSKDVSNYTFDDVTTELSEATTVLVFDVVPGDVLTVKAGTTTATFSVPPDLMCGVL
jgi:hypothetical protein